MTDVLVDRADGRPTRVPAGVLASYRRCRDLHRRHGRTYYLATRLLPAWKRPHVHALYAFTRYADELVDTATGDRERRLRDWSERFLAGLAGEPVDDPLLPAVLNTISYFRLDLADFTAFLGSMTADLTVTEYPDYPALLSYMDGSAAAVGTMMLPILEPADRVAARAPARQLGFAFQLTNFIRDVAEDLDRGRIYLPQADLTRFGVTPTDLRRAAASRRSTGPIRALIAYEVDRARAHYAAAAPGIRMLAATSRPCIRTAFHVYGEILHEVQRAGYEVFAGRAVVPTHRRLRLLARALFAPEGI